MDKRNRELKNTTNHGELNKKEFTKRWNLNRVKHGLAPLLFFSLTYKRHL